MGRRPASGSGRRRGRTPLTGGGERLGLPQPTGCQHRDSPPDQRPQPRRQQQHQDQRVSSAQPEGLRRVPSAMRGTARAEPCRKRRRKPIATCSFCPSASPPPFRRNDALCPPVWGVTCQFRALGARPAHTRPAQCRILRSSCGRDHPTRPREKRRGRRERRPLGPAWCKKPTQARPAPSIKERSAMARKLSEPGCRCRSC